jgi:hypothetical protein
MRLTVITIEHLWFALSEEEISQGRSAKNDYQARTFVLGATRAQQLLAVLQ